jgi:hypothetical protein
VRQNLHSPKATGNPNDSALSQSAATTVSLRMRRAARAQQLSHPITDTSSHCTASLSDFVQRRSATTIQFCALCKSSTMPKRALSTSAQLSSSSLSSTFSSSSRSKQRRSLFQLLHGLPAALLSEVCAFLSVYQTVCTLRSTCHAMHDGVTADCQLLSHLVITSCSLPQRLLRLSPALAH